MHKLFGLFIFLSLAIGKLSATPIPALQNVYNPFSGRQDFIVEYTSSTLPAGSSNYVIIQPDQATTQDGQFNVSSGTIREKLMFDTDGDTYFQLTGDDLFLFVHGSLRQTWTTVDAEEFLLLENGDFILLENGDKIILE